MTEKTIIIQQQLMSKGKNKNDTVISNKMLKTACYREVYDDRQCKGCIEDSKDNEEI